MEYKIRKGVKLPPRAHPLRKGEAPFRHNYPLDSMVKGDMFYVSILDGESVSARRNDYMVHKVVELRERI